MPVAGWRFGGISPGCMAGSGLVGDRFRREYGIHQESGFHPSPSASRCSASLCMGLLSSPTVGEVDSRYRLAFPQRCVCGKAVRHLPLLERIRRPREAKPIAWPELVRGSWKSIRSKGRALPVAPFSRGVKTARWRRRGPVPPSPSSSPADRQFESWSFPGPSPCDRDAESGPSRQPWSAFRWPISNSTDRRPMSSCPGIT